MGKLQLWFLVAATATALIVVQGYNINDVLEKVAENEMKLFLKHHVTLGYELSNVDISRNKKIPQDLDDLPPEFSIALYEKYRKYHFVPNDGSANTQENIICFPNGECIDIDDPGAHPNYKQM